jgi:phosphoglucosamine mutase
MKRRDQRLSTLAKVMKSFPQVLVNVKVPERRPLEDFPAVGRAVKDAEKKLGESGRVLVRWSGTEPKVRVMIEGRRKRQITAMAGQIAQVIEESLRG